MSKKAEGFSLRFVLINTGNISRKVLSKVLRSFDKNFERLQLLENFGYAEGATGSPRTILKTAYKAGMISDEELWLDALVSRNNVAHAYNQAIAMDIICQTKEKYYDMFIQLEKKIEQDWL